MKLRDMKMRHKNAAVENARNTEYGKGVMSLAVKVTAGLHVGK